VPPEEQQGIPELLRQLEQQRDESHPAGWRLLPLVLLPLICCAFGPLAIVVIAGASAAVLGGGIAVALVVIGGVAFLIWRRRRCQTTAAHTEMPPRVS
jgi:hypothetical protein